MRGCWWTQKRKHNKRCDAGSMGNLITWKSRSSLGGWISI